MIVLLFYLIGLCAVGYLVYLNMKFIVKGLFYLFLLIFGIPLSFILFGTIVRLLSFMF